MLLGILAVMENRFPSPLCGGQNKPLSTAFRAKNDLWLGQDKECCYNPWLWTSQWMSGTLASSRALNVDIYNMVFICLTFWSILKSFGEVKIIYVTSLQLV